MGVLHGGELQLSCPRFCAQCRWDSQWDSAGVGAETSDVSLDEPKVRGRCNHISNGY